MTISPTRTQIVDKIQEIIDYSDLLPKWLPQKASKLEINYLEKLLLIVVQAYEKELTLNKQEKEEFKTLMQDYLQEKVEVLEEETARIKQAIQNKDLSNIDLSHDHFLSDI